MARKQYDKKRSQKKAILTETIETRVVRPIAPEPLADVVTERTYITTEPEVEIRRPATLAQALTERAVAVVKPRTKVRKERIVEPARRRVA
jgi:hypothetical protein